MKRGGIILTIILSILALIVGFGGATTALLVTQPAQSGSTVLVNFEVHEKESFASVAQRLQDDGLIRNALAFKQLAKLRHKDAGIEPGIYSLGPSMTMSTIMDKLQTGVPDEETVQIFDGSRVAEYAASFSSLSDFNADDFNKIVQSGVLPDGTTKLSDMPQYWFVEPKQPNTVDALEGYLYADTYNFDKSATATDVIEKMLDTFGEHLCPGSDSSGPYFMDETRCKAHPATVDDKGTSIFTTLEASYDSKDDRHAIYLALTVASIAEREVPATAPTHDIQGVASVYFNRYQHAIGNPHYPSVDVGTLIEADPTVQYAVATDNPPKAGETWWPNINNQNVKTIETKNPYNTYLFPGLPPGPISSPYSGTFLAAANPVSPDAGKLYYYIQAGQCDGKTYFATNLPDHQAQYTQYWTNEKC